MLEHSEKPTASANWINLQKTLGKSKRKLHDTVEKSRKKRRLNSGMHNRSSVNSTALTGAEPVTTASGGKDLKKWGELKAALQQMVLGHLELTEGHKEPGKYLAVDCEMVGVGIDGSESSLARVSVVNFHGATILDEFVRQKERVVDYRTQWSGIREKDMIEAKPFEDVQQKVADLLRDRILIGHAVYNDLKALLLSHPRPSTRDTQYYAHKHSLTKTNRPALRNLVKQELDITIQSGEHSSVTDARATMAIYRLHKKEWEKGARSSAANSFTSEVVAQTNIDSHTAAKASIGHHPSGNLVKAKVKANISVPSGSDRKGVSSGISTVVKHSGVKNIRGRKSAVIDTKPKPSAAKDWWKELPGGSLQAPGGSKLRLTLSP
ncbi:ribonuclease H-like domain-containing protein [Crepidotus variabilis]|uniref:RNA exonuclease 4 n=1 Tax=Crepidotus variabilis TaxID=179855 RepID=A0A9P6E9R1_9AGAR|nr:ribonuclease H-like domain-containing protein [Crepidotus variabilis]